MNTTLVAVNSNGNRPLSACERFDEISNCMKYREIVDYLSGYQVRILIQAELIIQFRLFVIKQRYFPLNVKVS
jgi:hypothetical protein